MKLKTGYAAGEWTEDNKPSYRNYETWKVLYMVDNRLSKCESPSWLIEDKLDQGSVVFLRKNLNNSIGKV